MEITKKHIKNGLRVLATIYVLGMASQLFREDREAPNAKSYLSNRKEAITRNIETYNKNMSVMSEPFVSQYKDSLESAVNDTTVLGKEIKIVKEKSSRFTKRVFSSWFGYFVD